MPTRFDADRAARRFYQQFRTERAAFIERIDGIADERERDWYASLMLYRLMFLIFIQQRRFLDDDPEYLSNLLARFQAGLRDDERATFYRERLIPLFHLALSGETRPVEPGATATPSPSSVKTPPAELGRVPRLRMSLFRAHHLEEHNPEIEIPDEAFERLFSFFGGYRWRLDTAAPRSADEINPDVLGYILETHVNQKQMGAYYTKEDISDYISVNAIIPVLFEMVERRISSAFGPRSGVWALLAEKPERYIHPLMQKGVLEDGAQIPLPQEIADGLTDVTRRAAWNSEASERFALPTETWREAVARRERCLGLRAKLSVGEVRSMNSLITLNLRADRFARDVLETCESPELLRAFYLSLARVTILDPTCGSGSFLFAALRALTPLYEACLERMRALLVEAETCPASERSGERHAPLSLFRRTLKRVGETTRSRRGFILDSIITNNLHGVDLMTEAVEICRLRLLLKLMTEVEKDASKPNLGLGRLPRLDSNIRAGNALVGYLRGADAVRTAADGVGPVSTPRRSSHSLRADSNGALTDALDRRLSAEYAAAETDGETRQENAASARSFEAWRASHQPFHWFAEFPEQMRRGGFDCVVGNPPYVEYSSVRSQYAVPQTLYRTASAGNLYAFVIERSQALVKPRGSLGMIVPLSAFCTERMRPLIQLVRETKGEKWIAHFGWRPGKLFDGVNIPLAILLARPCDPSSGVAPEESPRTHTTTFNKWYRDFRPALFPTLYYASGTESQRFARVIPKTGADIEGRILRKLFSKRRSLGDYRRPGSATSRGGGATLFYRNTGGLYWRIFTDFQPFFSERGRPQTSSSTESTIEFADRETLSLATAVLNSNLYWFFYVVFSSFHHVNAPDILEFPVDFEEMDAPVRVELRRAAARLMRHLRERSEIRRRRHRGGRTSRIETFYPSRSKPLVDEIDRLLARLYGFDPEELDFIINYDIKYRMADPPSP